MQSKIRLMHWRDPSDDSTHFPSCSQITLPEGVIVSNKIDEAQFIHSAAYRQSCYQDAIPMLDTNVGFIMNQFATPLPLMADSWNLWTLDSDMGAFAYSVVPVVYSISALAVITWFLTIFVLTNYTIKASLLLRASTTLLSIYLLVTTILTIQLLNQQQAEGYLHGAELLDFINTSNVLNILDLIVVILLQINQAQVIMRIFLRQKDKRFTLLVGVVCTLTSQVVWAVTKFHDFRLDDEAGDILPAFIYLVRIAMGVCYAAIISVYIFTKINLIIGNRSLWLLTFLTSVLIYSPVAFFIADVSNSWVSELSEVFLCVTYVICVVIPWEWCNRLNVILRAREKDGLLGRRFYEDELYELDRFELFTENENNDNDNDENDENNNDNDNENSTSQNGPKENHITHLVQGNKIVSLLGKTKLTILNLTDLIIATGLAIPRSVSVSTPPIKVAQGDAIQLENFGSTNARQTTSQVVNEEPDAVGSSRNRRDVFLYSRREVVINFSDSE